nr:hypothetical protein [Streptomyces rochei]
MAWFGETVWGGDTPTWFFIIGIALSALAQSLALGTAWTTLRDRRRGRLTTAG